MHLSLPVLLCSLTLVFSLSAQADQTADQREPPEQLSQMQSSLEALRSTLTRMGRERQRLNFTQPLTDKANTLEHEAVHLIGQHRHNQARQQLQLAMDVVKTGITTLRNQQTLIRSLDFTSSQDEYRYEQQRFQHLRQLVDLLINNKGNSEAISLRQQAQVISEAAAQQARDNRFNEAIKAQEQSNRLILRAIRRSGIDLPTS